MLYLYKLHKLADTDINDSYVTFYIKILKQAFLGVFGVLQSKMFKHTLSLV